MLFVIFIMGIINLGIIIHSHRNNYLFKYKYLFYINPLFYIIIYKSWNNIYNIYIKYYKEKKLIEEILPMLESIKSYLKAGLTPFNAIEATYKTRKWYSTCNDIMEYIIKSNNYGASLSDSLNKSSSFLSNYDLNKFLHLFLTSMASGTKTGGNLIDLISQLETKIRDMLTLKRKARVYTSQMRLQSIVISLAPLIISIVLYLLKSESIMYLLREKTGNIILLFLIILNITGYIALKKVSQVEGL